MYVKTTDRRPEITGFKMRTDNLGPRCLNLGANKAGFTLIELLAAMAILLIITLIVAQLFQQASVSWETGLRKAESTMKGRALADYIAQDLASAIRDNDRYKEFTGDGSSPEFWSLGEASGTTQRAVRYVKYSSSGGAITRTEDSGTPVQLVGSGASLEVKCLGGSASTLPLYAVVKIVISGSAQYQSTACFDTSKRNNF